jgi:hypothetical protein
MNRLVYLDMIASRSYGNVPILIYVGIGCAAVREEFDNKTNQQLPMWLRRFKEDHANTEIHCFLIDPMLEDVPKCVTIYGNFTKVNSEMFFDFKLNMTIYAIRDRVHHDEDPYKSFFALLNNYSKRSNWLTIVSEYTGKESNTLREFYAPTIESHEDHIVYGNFIDDVTVNTCVIDMTAPECQYVFRYNDVNNSYSVINPYCFEHNYWLSFKTVLDDLPLNDRNVVMSQFNVFLLRQKRFILNTLFFALSGVFDAINTKSIIKEWKLNHLKQLMVKNTLQQIDFTTYDEITYNALLDELTMYYKHECIHYLYMVYGEYTVQVIDDSMTAMFKEHDVTKWSTLANALVMDLTHVFA